jgi:hypothetical protein
MYQHHKLLDFIYYLDIFLEELRKAMENLRIAGVSAET